MQRRWGRALKMQAQADAVGRGGQAHTGSMACSKPSALLQHAATLRDAAKMRIASASPFEMHL